MNYQDGNPMPGSFRADGQQYGGQPGYGAPPGAYGAPPQAYGQPPYGAPAPGGYGAPAGGGYGAPAPGGYGAPAAGGYGAPAPGGYGAPAAGGYGAPPSYGNAGPQRPPEPGFVNTGPVNSGQGHTFAKLNGRKKALLIGINYTGTNAALRGCINDVVRMREFLKANGFVDSPNTMVVLTDDQQENRKRPTRRNMIAAMQWLVQGAVSGDSLFLHYSGHGGQTPDKNGDEDDGYDETIFPVDYNQAGQIIDDELHDILVKPLAPGVRLTVVFDSCHSGTALDLPVVYDAGGRTSQHQTQAAVPMSNIPGLSSFANAFFGGNSLSVGRAIMDGINQYSKVKRGKHTRNIEGFERDLGADVVMFSGCRDDQTSMDANLGGIATGAMSFSLMEALQKGQGRNLSYANLLKDIRTIMQGKFRQIPQLSTGREMDMAQSFTI